jgi:hypothetical protein
MMANSSRRPQIYVHFEFGVSWSQRHPPNRHQVTYVSRNMRERNHASRHIPPPTTNYLAVAPRSHHQTQHRSISGPYPAAPHYQPEEQPQERRHSRQSSRSSHERGSSAPPPFHGNPWEVEPEPAGSSALPSSQPQPHVWKELPAVPSRFRLGEEGMPWSAWSGEYYEESDGGDKDEEHRATSSTHHQPHHQPHHQSHYQAIPSVFPPERAEHDYDGQRRELEALSAAMMTIDNGFEDQWWFQGPRETVAGDLHTASALPAPQPTRESLGWAVADTPQGDRASLAMQNTMISPMTDYGSPPPSYMRLSRSLTTRSEELFMPI